jgi:hypothetical protein
VVYPAVGAVGGCVCVYESETMYDKSILAKSTGASLGVVAIVGMLFLSTGTAFAAPISGIGGFVINADGIEGDDLILYPGDADAENASQYPQGVVELSAVEIESLELVKEFNLDQYGLSGNARIVISAGNNGQNATASSLLLKTPQLSADSATFSGLTIDETQSSNIAQVLTLRAPNTPSVTTREVSLSGGSNPGLQLHNPSIRATYLATNEITLPSLGLEVQFDPDNDNTYEYAG